MIRPHRRPANRRAALGTIRGVVLAQAMLVLAACGETHVTQPAPADVSGEYSYEITGSGGTCDELPRSTGTGVTLITQDQTWARECFQRDLCDGESCSDGYVEDNVFSIEYSSILQDGGCLILQDVIVTLTQAPDGSLARRMENLLSYDSGDCAGKTLPCSRWQTSTQSECPVPCYDSYCAGSAAAAETPRGGQDRKEQ